MATRSIETVAFGSERPAALSVPWGGPSFGEPSLILDHWSRFEGGTLSFPAYNVRDSGGLQLQTDDVLAPPVQSLVLGNVVLDVETGVVSASDGRICPESCPAGLTPAGWTNWSVRPKRAASFSATMIPIAYHSNYFHWMVERLAPALGAWRSVPHAVFVAHQGLPGRYKRFLAYLDLRVQYVEAMHLRPLQVVVPGYVPLAPLRRDLDALRAVTPRSHFIEPKPLVVSRRGQSRYSPTDLAVELKLQEHGFRVVHPERLELSAQLEVFRAAPVVVAASGAAVANAVWMAPSSTLVVYDPYGVAVPFTWNRVVPEGVESVLVNEAASPEATAHAVLETAINAKGLR